MVEINEATYAAAGYEVKDIYNFFTTISYLPFEIDKTGDLKPALRTVKFKNIIFKPA
jgi:hypothetical protein